VLDRAGLSIPQRWPVIDGRASSLAATGRSH